VILRADPAELTAAAPPLRAAAEVGREVDGARGELLADLTRAGPEPVRRSAESFLAAWATGLRGLSDRAEVLAAALDAAAADYLEAERRMRGSATAGTAAPAGPAGGGPA
jgi:hypothetical protein